MTARQYFSGGMDLREVLLFKPPVLDGGEEDHFVKVIKGNPLLRLLVNEDLRPAEVKADPDSATGFSIRINEQGQLDKGRTVLQADGGKKSGISTPKSNNWFLIASQAVMAGLVMVVAGVTAFSSASSAFWIGLIIPAVIPVLAVLAIPFVVSWFAQRSDFVKNHQLLITAQLMLAALLLVNLLPATGIPVFEPIGWFWHRAAEVWLNNAAGLPGLSDFFRLSVLGLILGNTAMLSGVGKSSPRENAAILGKAAVLLPWGVGLTLMLFMSLTGFPGLLAVPYAVQLFTIICSAIMVLPQLMTRRGGQVQDRREARSVPEEENRGSAEPREVPSGERSAPEGYRGSAEPAVVAPAAEQEEKFERSGENEDSAKLTYPLDEPFELTPEMLFKQWENELEGSKDIFAQDRLSYILNIAKHLMNYCILSEKIVSDKPEMDQTFTMTKRFVKLSRITAEKLLKEWRNNGLSPEQKTRIVHGIRFLLDTAEYNLEYEHAINSSMTTIGMSNYYFPRSDWKEQIGLMPFIRLAWGMWYAFDKSKNDFYDRFKKVARLGNQIESKLYVKTDYSKLKIEEYFNNLSYKKTKENQYNYYKEFGGNREMWSRFLPLVMALWPFLGALLGFPLNPFTLVIGLLTGLGASLFISWWTVFKTLQDDFYSSELKILNKLNYEFQELASLKHIEIPGDRKRS